MRITKPAEGVTRVLLGRAGTYGLRLAAPDHVPFEVTVDWDGRELTTRDGSVASDGGRSGVTLARGEATVAGRRLPDHHLFLGLRDAWFSAQARAPRGGNAVELLFDGEDAFRAIDVSLRGAQRSVLVSTWWWDSTARPSRTAGSST